MDDKKRKIILVGVALITILVALLGTTYAYWILTKKQEGTNKLIAACLEFEMLDLESNQYVSVDGLETYTKDDIEYVGGVSLESAYPLTNQEGLNLNGYKFKITNKCPNDAVSFSIGLLKENVESDEELLNDSSMKVAINDNIAGLYSELNDAIIPDDADDALSAKVIDGDTLAGGEEKVYTFKMWIDENTKTSEASTENITKAWNGKIFVTGTIDISDESLAMYTTSESCFDISEDGVITRYHYERKECGRSVSVPNSINDIYVKKISQEAFKNHDKLNPMIKFMFGYKSTTDESSGEMYIDYYLANVNGGDVFEVASDTFKATLDLYASWGYANKYDEDTYGMSEDGVTMNFNFVDYEELLEIEGLDSLDYATSYPVSPLRCQNGKDSDGYECGEETAYQTNLDPVIYAYKYNINFPAYYNMVIYNKYSEFNKNDFSIYDYDYPNTEIRNYWYEGDGDIPAEVSQRLNSDNFIEERYYIDLMPLMQAAAFGEFTPYKVTSELYDGLVVDRVDLSKCMHLTKIDNFAFTNFASFNLFESCSSDANNCIVNNKYDFKEYNGISYLKMPDNKETINIGIGTFWGANFDELTLYNNIDNSKITDETGVIAGFANQYASLLLASEPFGWSNIETLNIKDVNGTGLFGRNEYIEYGDGSLSDEIIKTMINNSMFTETFIGTLNFDSSIKSIGQRSFDTAIINNLYLPNSIKNIYSTAFDCPRPTPGVTDDYYNLHLYQTVEQFEVNVNNDDGIDIEDWNIIIES